MLLVPQAAGRVVRLKRVLAIAVLVLGVTGLSVAAAVPASAIPIRAENKINLDPPNDEQYCARINVTIFGNAIGTGADFVCIP